MQTNQILSAPLIDIIFDGRNKAYGAYELRKTYEKRIKKALLITFTFAALAFGGVVMAGSFKKNTSRLQVGPEMTLQHLPEEKQPEKLPEQPKPKPVEPEVQTIRNTTLDIKPDDEVETPPPSQTDMDDSKIDLDTKAGVPDEGAPDPGPADVGDGKGIVEDKPTRETGPAENVDIDAKFDGNWKKFLETNLVAEVPVDNGAPAGRYSVVIRFIVDTDGSFSKIEALTAHGYGMEEEAVRVIKRSKKWEPAFLNGTHVKAYKKQVIVFVVEGE